ncbi:MAG: OmpW family outer membrane protein, partial [Cyanobacteria bacterium J06621_11]
ATTAAHIKPQLEIEKTLAFSTIVETAPVVEESVQLQAIQPVTEAAALINPIKAETFNEIAASDEINSELAYPATTEDAVEVAQARRRTRATALGSDYIGIGADIGYADDFGFAAISKFSFSRRFAIRPSVVIGDDFSVLVPVTYDFSQYSGDMGGFPIRPYAGVGASYTNTDEDNDDNDDGDDDSDINLLLSAGVDIPISRRFTFNSQVNWGVLEESQFGITVGVGYNLGNLIGR